MDTDKKVSGGSRQVWRWALLMGAAASLSSLILGIFLQTVFYEVASGIPPVVRQDAHVVLPLCRLLPTLSGCDPWVGALTGLQIWELSLQVGQAAGLLINLILVSCFAMWVTLRVRSHRAMPGLLTGAAGAFSCLVLALAFDVPLSPRSFWGVFGILSILLLLPAGWVGSRLAMQRMSRQLSHRAVHFLPGDGTLLLEGTGESLSQRELEVLALVAEGLRNREIAERLYLSSATVKTHLVHIFAKLGVANRTAAVRQAVAYGLLRQEAEDPAQPPSG